jgi:hypothetical protein
VSTRGYSPERRVNPLYQLLAGPLFWAAAIVWDYQPWKLPVTVLWFLPVTYWLAQRSHHWDEPRVRTSAFIAAGRSTSLRMSLDV